MQARKRWKKAELAATCYQGKRKRRGIAKRFGTDLHKQGGGQRMPGRRISKAGEANGKSASEVRGMSAAA
jgi:hypothetical protein